MFTKFYFNKFSTIYTDNAKHIKRNPMRIMTGNLTGLDQRLVSNSH